MQRPNLFDAHPVIATIVMTVAFMVGGVVAPPHDLPSPILVLVDLAIAAFLVWSIRDFRWKNAN